MASATGGNNASGGPARGQGQPRAQKVDDRTLGDRLPPQSLEAEQGVLGSILLDNEVMHDVVGFLRVEDFHRDAYQLVFQAMRDLYDQAKGIDAVILVDELKRRGEFERIGGEDTLVEIIESVPHAANGKYYAEIVKEKAIVRRLIESATEILRDGYSSQFTARELLESAERRVFSIAQDEIRGATLELKDVVLQAMDRIALRAETKHAVTGIGTGLIDLDDLLGGLQGGQLVILAARPSMGKTALALNICDHASIALENSVLFVSLEMGGLEIAERLLCARSRIDGHKLRTGIGLGNREMTELGRAYSELANGRIFIDDTPSRNMLQITAVARRLGLRNKLGLIVLDYIQLVDSEDSRDSRQEQIAKISRRLKALARELGVPVIALSQLNRAVESREDRRPRMADLRESGAIEQDADIVLLLHRPEYYDANEQPGIAELIIAKNRNGPTGTVKLTFMKNLTKFENLANIAEPYDGGGAAF